MWCKNSHGSRIHITVTKKKVHCYKDDTFYNSVHREINDCMYKWWFVHRYCNVHETFISDFWSNKKKLGDSKFFSSAISFLIVALLQKHIGYVCKIHCIKIIFQIIFSQWGCEKKMINVVYTKEILCAIFGMYSSRYIRQDSREQWTPISHR